MKSDINAKVFMNGEKARTWNSRQNNIPGMFASVTATINANGEQFAYISDAGVQNIAYEKVGHTSIVTPYSTMALFLADEASASVWYHNMISGPAGQTKFGSIESLDVTGSAVSPMTTWDSKITTVVGMMGGLVDSVTERMVNDKVFDEFLDVVN